MHDICIVFQVQNVFVSNYKMYFHPDNVFGSTLKMFLIAHQASVCWSSAMFSEPGWELMVAESFLGNMITLFLLFSTCICQFVSVFRG